MAKKSIKPSKSAQSNKPGPPAESGVTGGVIDRRLGLDRREIYKMGLTGLERRRGPGRRLSDFSKAAEEGEMTKEQFLFLMAIDAFKKSNEAIFPTWTDVLEVVRLLGYRKTMASELNLPNAEDWREGPFGDANVRPERWGERFEDDEVAAMPPNPIALETGDLDLSDTDDIDLDTDDLDLDELNEAA